MVVSRDRSGSEPGRRGAALVEFAVLLPLLMLLFVGSIEVGRAINVRQTLCEASRAGARIYSMQTKKTPDDAKAIVDSIMQQAGLENYTVTLAPEPGTEVAQLDPVSVTVSMSAADASWYPTPWFLGRENVLRANCVMPADLEESASGEALDTADSTGPLIDSDETSELSGTENVSAKELEKEADKLVKEAKRLRKKADKEYERAQQDFEKASHELEEAKEAKADGDAKDYAKHYEKYEKSLAKYEEHTENAKQYDADAHAAEQEARAALARAAAASP